MKKLLILLIVCHAGTGLAQDRSGIDSVKAYQQLLNLLETSAKSENNPLLKEHFLTIHRFAQDTSHGFLIEPDDYGLAKNVLAFFQSDGRNWNTYLDGPRPLMLSFQSEEDGLFSYYWVFLPKDYDPSMAYPLYLELHGSGGGSNNNPRKMLFTPLQPEVKGVPNEGYRKEGIFVYPWGRGDKGYRGIAETDILEVLENVDSRFNTDPDRQYMYGFSMGGMGTFRIALITMERWAAIGSYSGAFPPNHETSIESFRNMPIWMAWGEEERWAEENRKIRDQFIETGINVNWREIEDTGHNYLGEYQNELLDWLKEHHK